MGSQVPVDRTYVYKRPGMDRNYCLIVFIVYMSSSDTQKVAKFCVHEKKSMLMGFFLSGDEQSEASYRFLSTSTCAWDVLMDGRFDKYNATIIGERQSWTINAVQQTHSNHS